MSFDTTLDNLLSSIPAGEGGTVENLGRIREELEFARKFCELFPDREPEWQQLILKAAQLLRDRLSRDLATAVAEAEAVMSPIGELAKKHTVHCVAHAHIDMNWTWPWLETVTICHDTFATVDRLMEDFPDLKFSQSQIAVYAAMEKYAPEIFEMIRRRLAERRWEVTASMWVESDKNLASGESICRHLLYSRRYLKERFGLSYDAVKIAWEGDTFGHPWTLPGLLRRGGVTRYYHCRPSMAHWLARWRSQDGSEVMAFCDKGGYHGQMEPREITGHFLDYVRETGLKDFLWVYGVGDHGGAPTRKQLARFEELCCWPIFPSLRLSTTDDYFSAVERCKDSVRVFAGELNPVFEGCYTSQSKAKKANRAAESLLPEAEAAALIAEAATGFSYPRDRLARAWQLALFNQFHDILAGSSGHEAMEEAEARFREAEAIAGSVRARALQKIAAQIDTSALGTTPDSEGSPGDAFGVGAGNLRVPGRVSTMNTGALGGETVIVFNSLAFPRSELVTTKVWNRDWPDHEVIVRDDRGGEAPAQVIGTSHYASQQKGFDLIFRATDIPGVGYRTYTITRGRSADLAERVWMPSPATMENAYLLVEVDRSAGAIKHLIDKATGFDYVPEGELMGALESCQEAPHAMTAWALGPMKEINKLTGGGVPVGASDLRYTREGDSLGMLYSVSKDESGPLRASVRTVHQLRQSWICSEIGLSAGSRMVEITLTSEWREMGTPERGVPVLRIAFPARITEPRAFFEIPFGCIERPPSGDEVVGQRWANISGVLTGADKPGGITLLNDGKYGFSADSSTLRATLLRSSYDPDPLPEMGRHKIRLAVLPHDSPFSVPEAMRAAAAFNQPMSVVGAEVHHGPLPPSTGFVEVLTPNVMLAGLKKAEDTEATVLRLYEVEGKQTEAKIRLTGLVKPDAPAGELDLLEQPLDTSRARMTGEILSVTLEPYDTVTVAVR